MINTHYVAHSIFARFSLLLFRSLRVCGFYSENIVSKKKVRFFIERVRIQHTHTHIGYCIYPIIKCNHIYGITAENMCIMCVYNNLLFWHLAVFPASHLAKCTKKQGHTLTHPGTQGINEKVAIEEK